MKGRRRNDEFNILGWRRSGRSSNGSDDGLRALSLVIIASSLIVCAGLVAAGVWVWDAVT